MVVRGLSLVIQFVFDRRKWRFRECGESGERSHSVKVEAARLTGREGVGPSKGIYRARNRLGGCYPLVGGQAHYWALGSHVERSDARNRLALECARLACLVDTSNSAPGNLFSTSKAREELGPHAAAERLRRLRPGSAYGRKIEDHHRRR